MSGRWWRATAVGLAVAALSAGADVAPLAAQAQRPDSGVVVELLTIGQGEEIFEKFGHNAIVIRDPATGYAGAYNWGVFDFNQPNFIGRFLTGDTKYWVAAYPVQASIDFYQSINRTVEVQRLRLTTAQALALRNLVDRNLLEENKYYRYDYYRDNCSTRVRDMLDQVLGGTLRRATEAAPGEGSFRMHTQRLVASSIPMYAGITIALGRRADSTLSRWDEMFLPMKVRDRVRELKVPGPNGELVPLVAEERVVFASTREPERTQSPHWTGAFFAAGALVAALVLALARSAPKGGAPRALLIAFGTGWGSVTGLMGVVLLLAATATKHVYWQQNVSLALLPPTGLLFAPLWWRWLATGAPGRGTTIGFAAFLAPPVLGTLLALVDGGWHGALPIVAFTLPVHASLVAAVTLVSARDRSRTLRFSAP